MTELERLRGVKYCGIWQIGEARLLLQDPVTGTSFTLAKGQTLGEALDDVRHRYGELDGLTRAAERVPIGPARRDG